MGLRETDPQKPEDSRDPEANEEPPAHDDDQLTQLTEDLRKATFPKEGEGHVTVSISPKRTTSSNVSPDLLDVELSFDSERKMYLKPVLHDIALQPVKSEHQPLSGERATELQIEGLRGVGLIREKVIQAIQLTNTLEHSMAPRRAGLERERSLVSLDTHEPAYEAGSAVLDAIRRSKKKVLVDSTDPELGRHQLEHNTPVFTMAAGALEGLEQHLREYDAAVDKIARKQGARAVSTGILASFSTENLVQSSLNPGPRYDQLVAALTDSVDKQDQYFSREMPSKDGPITVRFFNNGEYGPSASVVSDRAQFVMDNVSVLLESAMTSLQVHIPVPNQAEYVGHHRTADLISPALIAASANSPLLFGRPTGFQESRNGFLWQVAVSPWRTGFLRRDWLADPVEQLQDAQTFGPLLEPATGGKGLDDSPEAAINIARENAKTIWPFNRATFAFNGHGGADGDVRVRVENRVMPAGPTVTDEVAHFALAYGGTIGMYKLLKEAGVPIDSPYPQQLDRVLHFMETRDNMFKACADGMEAEFTWINGTEISSRDFLKDVLVPAAQYGLMSLGVTPNEAYKYLQPVVDRANFDWDTVPYLPQGWEGKQGMTPADVTLYLDSVLKTTALGAEFLDREARGRKIVELMCEAHDYDNQAAAAGESSRGIQGWFEDKFLPQLKEDFVN